MLCGICIFETHMHTQTCVQTCVFWKTAISGYFSDQHNVKRGKSSSSARISYF
jgi:hypothetical protein